MTQTTPPPGPPPVDMDAAAVADRVAGAVRAEMARQRLSGRDLAARSGVGWSTLARRVRGDQPGFRLDELLRVAAALGVTVSDLVGDRRP